MINLLPDDRKRNIRAARMNVTLLKYNILSFIALTITLGVCLLFFVIMRNEQSSAITTSNDNSIKASSYAKVRKEADEYRANLTIASKILDNSVNYTNVVFEITKLLPEGVILDGINLTAADFGRQTAFTARAKSYDQAMKLKESFQNSTVFEDVHFQNITDTAIGSYPLTVSISATLKKVDMNILKDTAR